MPIMSLSDRVQALSRERPESGQWLALLHEARRQAEERDWTDAVPVPGGRADHAPLLAGAAVALDVDSARRWLRRLWKRAQVGRSGPAEAEAAELFEAAVVGDGERMDRLARRLELAPDLARALGELFARPFLLACGRAWSAVIPTDWIRAYCPICGGWPTLAESRGLEQSWRLRCARDGADWYGEQLRCVYCGTREHQRLGSLVSESARDPWRVEICDACGGFLKSATTIMAAPAAELALLDAATVDLDIVALAKGYARPARRGYLLALSVAEKRRGSPARMARMRSWLG